MQAIGISCHSVLESCAVSKQIPSRVRASAGSISTGPATGKVEPAHGFQQMLVAA